MCAEWNSNTTAIPFDWPRLHLHTITYQTYNIAEFSYILFNVTLLNPLKLCFSCKKKNPPENQNYQNDPQKHLGNHSDFTRDESIPAMIVGIHETRFFLRYSTYEIHLPAIGQLHLEYGHHLSWCSSKRIFRQILTPINYQDHADSCWSYVRQPVISYPFMFTKGLMKSIGNLISESKRHLYSQ